MKFYWRICLIIILLVFVGAPKERLLPVHYRLAQGADFTAEAQAVVAGMSVEERVGQLFLVTFMGDDASPNSDIAELILNYRVGGVALLADNDNMSDSENTPEQAARLANDLQRMALREVTFSNTDEDDTILPPTRVSDDGTAIPLLIAMSHEGDGYPHNQILNGLTKIPNQMSIGATWQPQYARTAGEVVGQELSAIGVNMLLGPSLDVLDNPALFYHNGLGTRSFGGDPYWVGLMGQAYTSGVHSGGNGRVAVIAKHFPGFGSSDRPMGEEVATVRKSLDQLRQTELAPFFAVTGRANSPEAVVDGLMAGHIRYQDFQGNIRATTAPISFDPQALATLMQLSEFADWRQQGGLIVSDSLGVRAVQRFYDDTEQDFPHRRVARDALLAGNDLLFLSDFALQQSDYALQLANTKDTITWFQEKYRTDQSFRQRIDEAATRIVRLKLQLYNGDFNSANILADVDRLPDLVGQSDAAMFDLAREAITLISPSPGALVEILPPKAGDTIVIFTDVRQVRQCTTCLSQPLIGVTDLEQRLLELYGPEGSSQVQDNLISSFSFVDLQAFLAMGPGPIQPPVSATSTVPTLIPDADLNQLMTPTPQDGATATPVPTPEPPPAFLVQSALQNADWIIFAMLDSNVPVPAADALHNFLAQRPDIARSSQVIVFAYNAPYFLDTTEISKLTAYFGVYSQTDPFIDASVRTLFQELSLRGYSPVGIEGIRYNLSTITQPDPRQILELYIVAGDQLQSPPGEAPLEATPGDTLRLQTGVVRDRNGHPVPDGTLVQFIREDRIQGFINVIAERPTVKGIANLDMVLEARTGHFRITAVAGEARTSQEIDIVIGENAAVSVRTPLPTPTPTMTATPTATFMPTRLPATPRPTATITPSPTPIPESREPELRIALPQLQMMLGVMIGLIFTSGVGLFVGRNGYTTLVELVRWLLWGVIGGLICYNYFALGLPGTAVLSSLGVWAGLLTTITGGLITLGVYHYLHK